MGLRLKHEIALMVNFYPSISSVVLSNSLVFILTAWLVLNLFSYFCCCEQIRCRAVENQTWLVVLCPVQVIKTLDPKLNPASAEIMLLRKQIMEKDKKIEALEVKIYIYLMINNTFCCLAYSSGCLLMTQCPSMLHSVRNCADIKPRDFQFGLINRVQVSEQFTFQWCFTVYKWSTGLDSF